MFTSTLNGIEGTLTIQSALLCTIVSLVLGIFIAVIYMLQGTYTKNFVVTLAILPVLVQLVIMLVNGNVGTSVAVLGTFSLIRFRSVPGSSREIVSIFFSMAENLDYTGVFEDIFQKYTSKCSLQRVKTTNLGSMYELDYHITLKDASQEKEMIDAIRCRNGNLTIICGRRSSIQEEL